MSVKPAAMMSIAFAMACGANGGAQGARGPSQATDSHAWTPPTARDTHDDPAQVRPGYGNAELRMWFPLTAPEVAALQGIDKAKAGDWKALLDLAIMASGDKRDAASYARYEDRVSKFIADVRPTMEGAADEWHRGYELNRAMHRAFFNERGDLGGYLLQQGRITGIFETGRYNCLSSALLYIVLARAFGLPVRGVVVPTHVFIEIGAPGAKIVEVETTTNTGFDWVHDERFYREGAANWSRARGLRPVTIADYQKREILDPYRVVAHAMNSSYPGATEQDRLRLAESAARVDPDSTDAQHQRVLAYNREALNLFNLKATHTSVKMLDLVVPWVSEATMKVSGHLETMQWAAWVASYYSMALGVVGRGDDAVAVVNNQLDQFDARWDKADVLRNNCYHVLNDRMLELMAGKDYEGALRVVSKHFDGCRSDRWCGSNVSVVYRNWSSDKQNVGDWPAARDVLRQCLETLPNDADCASALSDLESRHRF